MKQFFLFFAVLFGVAAVSVPVSAAKKKSFDIYSWAQAGTSNYCYAIVASSKEPHPVSEIKASQDQVCGGRDDLKRIVGQVALMGSKLYWKVDAANGLELPTRDIVNDFQRFAETIPYTVVVEEPK